MRPQNNQKYEKINYHFRVERIYMLIWRIRAVES